MMNNEAEENNKARSQKKKSQKFHLSIFPGQEQQSI